MPRTFKVTKKPDPDTKREDIKDRQWLAEISDENGEVDAAYFPTKAAGEQWVRDTYSLL